jgi:hypothetical protein
MKPLCFVLMPFGRKQDGTGRLIDFDAVYLRLIREARTVRGEDIGWLAEIEENLKAAQTRLEAPGNSVG